jgi:predicted PurR-regulated permease PerM
MPPWVKRAIVWFWVGALATFYAVGVVRALRTLLVVLLVSLFVAFALEPAVNFLAERHIRRGIATALAFVVITGLAALFSAIVGTALATETTYLIEKAPTYIDEIGGWLDDTFGIELDFDSVKEEFLVGGGLQDLFSRFADDVVNVGATLVSLLFHLFTVALFTFYLVAEGPKLRDMVSKRLSERRARVVTTIWDLAMDKTGKYMYSRTILAILSAIVHWIAFALLDVPSPVALAIWVGVISQFIPAIGAYIAGVLPVLVALLHSPRTGLFVLIVIVAYQQVENYFFSPRVTAHTMEIHVALAFGSVIAGTALLGIVGAFLALPVAATAQAFISSWLDEHSELAKAAEAAAGSEHE